MRVMINNHTLVQSPQVVATWGGIVGLTLNIREKKQRMQMLVSDM